jgi:hypothetical protein
MQQHRSKYAPVAGTTRLLLIPPIQHTVAAVNIGPVAADLLDLLSVLDGHRGTKHRVASMLMWLQYAKVQEQQSSSGHGSRHQRPWSAKEGAPSGRLDAKSERVQRWLREFFRMLEGVMLR